MTRFDAKTALIVVDVQNDFADRAGSLYVEGAQDVIMSINSLVRSALGQGAFVVYTQDWHPDHTPHFVEGGGSWPKHCVKGTWGAELVSTLEVDGPVVQKGTAGEDGYSGFSLRDPETGAHHKTPLDRMLRERHIERVVIVGLAQDVCVKETALDARRLGYDAEVVAAATRPVDADAGRAALTELSQAGVTIT